MKTDNPFSLSFGRQPITSVNRLEDLNEITSAFSANNPVYQTYLISGLRGSGKTVLMTTVVKELINTGNWISVDLNSSVDLLEDFAMRLSDACKKTTNLTEGGIDISLAGFGIGLSGSKGERDNVSKIESLLEYAKKKNKRVIITIDEVIPNESMRIFTSQFQIFVRKDFPVFLIMTGLYENIYAIQNDSQLTFLLRSPKIMMEPLSILQIKNQYQTIFNFDETNALKFAALTKGYALAFQALGFLYWDYKDQLSFEEILKKFDELLENFAYKKIWESLSAIEKKIIVTFDKKDKLKVNEIREALSMTSPVFSKYRERLLNRGILLSTEYGSLELSLPRFGKIAKIFLTYEEG